MPHFGPTLRRRRRSDRPGLRTVLAIVVSLLANWLLVSRIDPSALGLGPVKEVRPVDLAALSASDWTANRTIRDPRSAPAPNVPPPPPQPPPEEQRKYPGQVVETATSNAKPPKNTKYVSDRDNSADKETRSRFRGPGAPAAPPGPTGQGAAASTARGGQDGKSEKFVEGRVGERSGQDRKLAMNKAASKSDRPPPVAGGEIPTLPWDPKVTPEPDRAPGASGADAGDGGLRRPGQYDPRLALTPQTLARLAGGGSPDKLDNVDEGDGTFLNTREWKYATYFNRIKQAVSSTWNPTRALDQRDPDRTLFGNRDRYTLLSVTLDNTGALKDVVVKKTSGMEFLDKTTVEAFKRAQPFANPPPGIVEPNGEIRFTFGFYLEVGHGGFQIFRGGP
jgi:TonB family protein